MRISDWSSGVCSSDLVDRGREGVIGPRVDRGDEIEQRRAQAWHRTPVLIDDLQQYLPAGTVRLAVEPHRIADAEPVLDRHCARAGKRAVPAHRIAERDRKSKRLNSSH